MSQTPLHTIVLGVVIGNIVTQLIVSTIFRNPDIFLRPEFLLSVIVIIGGFMVLRSLRQNR